MSAERVHADRAALVALVYLARLLLVPVGLILYRTFEPGVGAVWDSITTPAAIHAFCADARRRRRSPSPLNTVFGILLALALVRGRFRGKWLLDALIDLPFAISPDRRRPLADPRLRHDRLVRRRARRTPASRSSSRVPGIVLATIFVSLPFVAREVAPVLREIGDEQEQAAATLGASRWQTFLRVTLPAIRWGVAYGVVLTTARAIGEFGAVSVVSGKIAGETETLTLLVEKRFQNFDLAGAYAASALLAVIALVTLLAMTLIKPRRRERR